jgi:hypothetical protein
MSSSFSVVKPSYLENTSNIVVNGNLTVNGTVSTYVDTSLNSLPENTIFTFGNVTSSYRGGVLSPNGKMNLNLFLIVLGLDTAIACGRYVSDFFYLITFMRTFLSFLSGHI